MENMEEKIYIVEKTEPQEIKAIGQCEEEERVPGINEKALKILLGEEK